MKKLWSLVLVLALMTMGAAALAEPAADETSATEPEDTGMGIWKLKAYVDEFDMPTDEYFIVSNDTYGQFNNRTTNNGTLQTNIFYFGDDFFMLRMVAGMSVVKNTSSTSKSYDFLIADDNGERHSFSGLALPNSQDIYISDDNHTLRKILLGGGRPFFIITESDNEYFFWLNADGFDKALEALGE